MGKKDKESEPKRKSYTIAFKRYAIKHYEMTKSKNLTTKNLKVPRTNIIKWLHNADAIKNEEQAQAKKKLLCAAKKKKGKFDANEQRVFEWYQQQKLGNGAVTNVLIQHRMLEDVRMHNPDGADKFKASEGWLRRFFIRFNIPNPKTNKTSRAISKDFVPVIAKFLAEVQTKAANYANSQIFNLSESCFFMDMPGNVVVARKQKLKLSCIFCADANGI
jgi:hypothetical protein